MANTLATRDWVTYEVARYFANSLTGVANFNREYSDEYRQRGGKVGDSVRIRKPQKFVASSGEGLVQQNLLDQTVQLTLNRRRHVGFPYSSQEATTDLDDIRNRYVMPAAETLANTYDNLSMEDVYKDVFNSVGTLGTTPSSALTFLQAKAKLLDFATPDDSMICAILDPWTNATLVNGVSSNFNPAGQLTENWQKGQFAANQLGIAKWLNDQNVPRFTSGNTTTSTPVVNGAGQTGSSLITDGWGSGATFLNAGDIITIAGVYSVNPLSKVSTGRLQQFVLTADVSDSTGDATLSISPSIITSGALQTVTASPANNAVVTYFSMTAGQSQAETVSPQNLVFHQSAFGSAMADLSMPNGGANGSRVSSKMINVAMRYVEQFDITSDQNLNRLDILFGSVTIFPERAARVLA